MEMDATLLLCPSSDQLVPTLSQLAINLLQDGDDSEEWLKQKLPSVPCSSMPQQPQDLEDRCQVVPLAADESLVSLYKEIADGRDLTVSTAASGSSIVNQQAGSPVAQDKKPTWLVTSASPFATPLPVTEHSPFAAPLPLEPAARHALADPTHLALTDVNGLLDSLNKSGKPAPSMRGCGQLGMPGVAEYMPAFIHNGLGKRPQRSEVADLTFEEYEQEYGRAARCPSGACGSTCSLPCKAHVCKCCKLHRRLEAPQGTRSKGYCGKCSRRQAVVGLDFVRCQHHVMVDGELVICGVEMLRHVFDNHWKQHKSDKTPQYLKLAIDEGRSCHTCTNMRPVTFYPMQDAGTSSMINSSTSTSSINNNSCNHCKNVRLKSVRTREGSVMPPLPGATSKAAAATDSPPTSGLIAEQPTRASSRRRVPTGRSFSSQVQSPTVSRSPAGSQQAYRSISDTSASALPSGPETSTGALSDTDQPPSSTSKLGTGPSKESSPAQTLLLSQLTLLNMTSANASTASAALSVPMLESNSNLPVSSSPFIWASQQGNGVDAGSQQAFAGQMPVSQLTGSTSEQAGQRSCAVQVMPKDDGLQLNLIDSLALKVGTSSLYSPRQLGAFSSLTVQVPNRDEPMDVTELLGQLAPTSNALSCSQQASAQYGGGYTSPVGGYPSSVSGPPSGYTRMSDSAPTTVTATPLVTPSSPWASPTAAGAMHPSSLLTDQSEAQLASEVQQLLSSILSKVQLASPRMRMLADLRKTQQPPQGTSQHQDGAGSCMETQQPAQIEQLWATCKALQQSVSQLASTLRSASQDLDQ